MRTGISWLDVKLGARMLVKYPGLTLVGGLGLAVAVAIGAVFFDVSAAAIDATLPFAEGERVVAIENWDTEINNQERQILHDFAAWREELELVEALGAWRQVGRNLITADGRAELVTVAEMTASGFRMARVPPLLGRTLVEEDQAEGAPPVVVIGHDVWRTRFAGDPDIVGRTVQLADTEHAVVGVMPEGFAFPVNHGFWVPLRAAPSDYERRAGPGIRVVGRLAPGATIEQAQAELTTVGRQMAAAFPETHARLQPRVVPYTLQFLDDMEGWESRAGQLLVIMLLIVICVNVAILVYARTATREGEVAVRSALGASRRRIVAQLFAEALVLSAGAAALGLGVAGMVLGRLRAVTERLAFVPFWMEFDLSSGTVAYVAGLAVLGAVIVGVVPALKATGRRVQPGLQRLATGHSGLQMGGTWTALIVAQVAIAVAVLPASIFLAGQLTRYGFAAPGFAAEEYVTARLVMDGERAPSGETDASEQEFAARYGDRLRELATRLEAEPRAADAAFASIPPGNELPVRIEVEGVPMPPESASGHRVRSGRVAVGFFDAFDVPVLAGRGFRSGDIGAAARAVVVNRAFVEQVLGGGNALARRVRRVGDADRGGDETCPGCGRWYEIVGVVGDLAGASEPGGADARLYRPMRLGEIHPATLALRMRAGAPAAFAPRLREITAAVDPNLQARDVLPLDEELREEQMGVRLLALGIALVTLSVLLLSAAGIHALMSFAVARRRKEIGIRSALGADPRRLLASIFSRALGQLAIGLAIGVGAAVLLHDFVDDLARGQGTVVVPGTAALMMVVGLLAALGPARRGLRIQPTEALKAE